MTRRLKVIAKYGTPEEAHLLRNRLEEAGIPAFLEGEMMAGWAWHFANALGGVKVLVPAEYAAAAEEILAPAGESQTAGAAARAEGLTAEAAEDRLPASWTCGHCGAEVDAAMDVCWACGTAGEATDYPELDDDTAEEPEPEERRALAPEVAMFIVLFPPTFAFFLFSKLCRLLAPLVPDVNHHAPADEVVTEAAAAIESEGSDDVARVPERGEASSEKAPSEALVVPGETELDLLVLRAWRAALMGFFLLPPLLMTLYSTWLLVQYWLGRRGANRSRDRRARWTLVVNVVAALCLGFFLSFAAGRFHDSVRQAPGVIGPHKEERTPYLGH